MLDSAGWREVARVLEDRIIFHTKELLSCPKDRIDHHRAAIETLSMVRRTPRMLLEEAKKQDAKGRTGSDSP